MAENKADRVKQVMQEINTSLWPDEAFDEDLPSYIEQLEQVPYQVSRWKKSSTRSGAGFALALTKAHFPRIMDDDLAKVGDGNPPGKECMDHLPTFLEATSKIASIIYLETFIEYIGVPDTLEDAPEDAGEEENE